MSSIRRFSKIIYGIILLLFAIILLISPREGAIIVVFFVDVALLLYGIRILVYYFTLARYMVGGIMTLYKSIIVIDFGLFIFYLYQIPYRFAMIYLVSVMALNGVTAILSAWETRRFANPAWKSKLLYGVVKLLLVVVSLFVVESTQLLTIMYCIGLIHAAFYSIGQAFKKSAIIYIG